LDENNRSELSELVEACAEKQEANTIVDELPEHQPKQNIGSPGVLAWVVAVLVMLFGLVMFIPAMLNGSLASYAMIGFAHELRGNHEAAGEVYYRLGREERDITRWANQNFTLGTHSTPGFTTNQFSLARTYVITGRLIGPLEFWWNDLHVGLGQQFEHQRMPRSLARLASQVEVLQQIVIDGAQRDDLHRRYHLIYDAVQLRLNIDDVATDEFGEALAALQAARGSERWMYAGVAAFRAQAMEDWELLVQLSEESLRHNPRDYGSMELRVRAMFLAGESEQAHLLAIDYGNEHDMLYYPMHLLRAELYYREGHFAQANEMVTSLFKMHDSGEVYERAIAIQGIVLLLQDKAEEAFELLRPYVEHENPETLQLLLVALTAAAAADDIEFVDYVIPPELQQEHLPQALLDFIAGETTIEAIFVEGWGGLS